MGIATLFPCLVALASAIGPDDSPEYREAYEQGRRDAEVALEDGTPAFLSYGLRAPDGMLDEESGLPFEAIAGCDAGDDILGRAAGNNDCVRASIAKNGLPRGSFKAWEKEIGDLEAFVASRQKIDPSKRLTAGGPAIKSPDGKFAIRCVSSEVKGGPGQPNETVGYIAFSRVKRIELKRYPVPVESLAYVLSREHVEQPQAEFEWGREADVTWGPEGSRFVVLHGRSRGKEVYHAIDASTGRTLGFAIQAAPAKPGA